MNTKLLMPFAAAAALFLGACESSPTASMPRISYPITYQVHVGNSQVASNYGPQTMNNNANQDVIVEPDVTLYYQVVSNVPVNVILYEKPDPDDPNTWQTDQRLQGTVVSSSFTPNVRHVQFAFGVVSTNTGGDLQFTLSDRPIPQPVVQYVAPAPYVAPPPQQVIQP